MANTCESAIVTCEDFRLHQKPFGENKIAEFVEKHSGSSDIITRGGGIKDLVRPQRLGFKESLLRDIEVSINLHEINTLYLINHEDCGGYQDLEFDTKENEINQHKDDLKEAKKILKKRFLGLEIKLCLARKKSGETGVFEIEKIDN